MNAHALKFVANETYEPATTGNDRLLILALAEHRAAVKEVARVEAEIATLARVWANQRGLRVRPRIEQLRLELGVA